MTELLTYVTSGFWVFLGCLIFTCGAIGFMGWAANAMLLGFKGIRCGDVDIF